MTFLEKDLETIIWENYEGCYDRGLNITRIGQVYGETRHRQVSLGPYGIADLVNVRYFPSQEHLLIQVIECKKDDVNLSTYGQAKRYLAALKDVFRTFHGLDKGDVMIEGQVILIGRRFESSGDFPFVYNEDDSCKAYTYEYGLEGLAFKLVPNAWNRTNQLTESAVAKFSQAFRDEASARYQAEGEMRQEHEDAVRKYGDVTSTLLVTPQGVLLNTDKINRFNQYGY